MAVEAARLDNGRVPLNGSAALVMEHPALAEWPVPVNLFSELSARPFEPAMVPAVIGRYPVAYAAATGIDPSITLVSAVVAAAAALTDRFQICGNSATAWFQQARLWALVIGEPGAGKSPAQRQMLAPLWQIHAEQDAGWHRECDAVDARNRALPRGELEEKIPARPRVLVGDGTIEGISQALVDNERGLLVSCDEFDSWLGSMDQYKAGGVGSKDRGEWLRLFDGGPHSIERIKRGTVFVPNWGASILTATTPAALDRVTRHLPTDGLLQRFLLVVARRQLVVPESAIGLAVEREKFAYAEALRRLWALEPRAHSGVVQLHSEARELFDHWRTRNHDLQEAYGSLEPALEAHLAKYPNLVLRLALTFFAAEVVHHPDEKARDPAAFGLPAKILGQAIAFLDRAAEHALAFYLGRRGGSEIFGIARDIARFALTLPPGVLQRRDLLRRVRSYRDAEEGAQGATLRLLVDLGWLRVTEDAGGYAKAVPTRYEVNPRIGPIFAALAEREKARRALVREQIAAAVEERRGDHHEH